VTAGRPAQPACNPWAIVNAAMRELASRGVPAKLTAENIALARQASGDLLAAFGVAAVVPSDDEGRPVVSPPKVGVAGADAGGPGAVRRAAGAGAGWSAERGELYRQLQAALAERDDARAAVDRVRALAAKWAEGRYGTVHYGLRLQETLGGGER
jgi:hypothetical protein